MLLERIYTACSHAIVLYRIGLRSLSFVFDYWCFGQITVNELTPLSK